jgi:hypothetical protein
MSKLKFLFAVVAIGMGVILWVQSSFNARLRRDNESLRGVMAELKQLQDVREPGATDDSSTKEQMAELLRLRAEATQLREETNQIGPLLEENKKLLVSLQSAKRPLSNESTGARVKKGPEDALPQDIHPKETWGYRGYASPDATVESTLWAMAHGDKAAMLEAFSPEMRSDMQKQMDGKDFAEAVTNMNFAEFRILDRRPLSDDEMVLSIYTARQDANGNTKGNTEDTVFQRIGGEWKVTPRHEPNN